METYPIFPYKSKYGIAIPNFDKYLNYTNNYINDIQYNSTDINEAFLSFYPIAKNIRFLSSYLYKGVLMNKKSVIGNRDRQGEANHWEGYCKRGSWYPWLWGRGLIEPNKPQEEMWGM